MSYDEKVIEQSTAFKVEFDDSTHYGYRAPYRSCGECIDTVSTYPDGSMWVSNAEYSTRVNYNPFTGEPALSQLPIKDIENN